MRPCFFLLTVAEGVEDCRDDGFLVAFSSATLEQITNAVKQPIRNVERSILFEGKY